MLIDKENKHSQVLSSHELLHKKGLVGTLTDPYISLEIKQEFQIYLLKLERLKRNCSNHYLDLSSQLQQVYNRPPTEDEILTSLDVGHISYLKQRVKIQNLLTEQRIKELNEMGVDEFDVELREWDNWYYQWYDWFLQNYPHYFT